MFYDVFFTGGFLVDFVHQESEVTLIWFCKNRLMTQTQQDCIWRETRLNANTVFQKAAQQLKALEQQKQAAQANLQPLLANTTSSALPLQLSAAKNKQDGIAALADLYTKK